MPGPRGYADHTVCTYESRYLCVLHMSALCPVAGSEAVGARVAKCTGSVVGASLVTALYCVTILRA